MVEIASDILMGCSERHLAPLPSGGLLHADVIPPLQSLQRAAAGQGIELKVASGFRSFERQLAIWNAKASGQRPVLDNDGRPIDLQALSPLERVHAIMRWSALPGASRHHWGTDIDIWDTAAVAADYSLQLVPQEYSSEGPFGPLSHWLDKVLAAGDSGFYRPYAEDRGGIAPEPWHLSYWPVAEHFANALTPARLAEVLDGCELVLKAAVLDNIQGLFERYIRTD